MTIKYEIFHVDYNGEGSDTIIKKMNELITNKLNEGWKLVGGICINYNDCEIFEIYQAMTLETVNENLLA